MTELLRDVLPWLAAFFLLDAVAQPRRGHALFTRAWAWGPFRLLGPGVHLAGPSPLGAALSAFDLPYLPARDALWCFDAAARSGPAVVRPEQLQRVAWSELVDVRAERSTVRVGARVLLRAPTPRAAWVLAEELRRLAVAPEADRDAEVARALTARLDVAAVRARWERVRAPARWAAVLGTGEAVLLFGVLPLLALAPQALPHAALAVQVALGLLLACHVGAVVAARTAMARGGARAADVASTTWSLALFPSYAARAGTHAVREAFSAFEPLAVAGVLASPGALRSAARRELVRVRESREATRALGVAAYWDVRERAVERALAQVGLQVREALARPAPAPGAGAWCPLCAAEYRAGFAQCSDCDVQLEPVGAAA